MPKLMIYGATGYTGRMAAQQAHAAGLPPVLAGRSPEPLARLAHELGVEYRVFDLSNGGAIRNAMDDISVLLNCAGPYMNTAEPLMRAAIDSRVHYLDVAAELDSYRLAEKLDGEARAAGMMLLPGSGGSVAMLGCLAGHAVDRVAHPRKVAVALHVAGSMSRGSAISASRNLVTETLWRRAGRLVLRPSGDTACFDFGAGPVLCFAVTLPELITIGRETGMGDVETFVHVSGGAFPTGDPAICPMAPARRSARRTAIRLPSK